MHIIRDRAEPAVKVHRGHGEDEGKGGEYTTSHPCDGGGFEKEVSLARAGKGRRIGRERESGCSGTVSHDPIDHSPRMRGAVPPFISEDIFYASFFERWRTCGSLTRSCKAANLPLPPFVMLRVSVLYDVFVRIPLRITGYITTARFPGVRGDEERLWMSCGGPFLGLFREGGLRFH